MRTKTLLLAAAAVAAGLVCSQTYAVNSLNVVGYINTPIPAGHFAIFGNQLINGSDVNKTNNDINVAFKNGCYSDTAGPNAGGTNTTYNQWDPNALGYNTYYYFSAAAGADYGVNGTPQDGFYTTVGDLAVINQNQGSAAFFGNPAKVPLTITVTGQVLQGTNKIVIASGYQLVSLAQPLSTNLVTGDGIGFPSAQLASDPNGPNAGGTNDIYSKWDINAGGFNQWFYFSAFDGNIYGVNGTPQDGFYTTTGDILTSADYPKVGEGFFLIHHGATINWTNVFVVQ